MLRNAKKGEEQEEVLKLNPYLKLETLTWPLQHDQCSFSPSQDIK